MLDLFGVRIVESPYVQPVPKIQVDPALRWISDECRRDVNRFLLETFGTKEVAYVIDPSYLRRGFDGTFGAEPMVALSPVMMRHLRAVTCHT